MYQQVVCVRQVRAHCFNMTDEEASIERKFVQSPRFDHVEQSNPKAVPCLDDWLAGTTSSFDKTGAERIWRLWMDCRATSSALLFQRRPILLV